MQDFIFGIEKYDECILHIYPQDITFKMMRDTRFLTDESSYKPVMRAQISVKGKLPISIGYYISIQPHDGAMLGGGLSAGMFKVATSMIKDYILETSEELEKIINHPDLCS